MRPSVLAWLMVAAPSLGVAQGYRPTYAEPRGTELVAVYFGATTCGPCRIPEMPAVLDSIKVQLQRQAEAANQRFRAVIVAIEWLPDSGLALAREDGLWDEIIVGRNWSNLGAQTWMWADSAVTPAMPQVIVFEQHVTIGGRMTFGPRRVLRRVHGADALAAWARRGSPARDAAQGN